MTEDDYDYLRLSDRPADAELIRELLAQNFMLTKHVDLSLLLRIVRFIIKRKNIEIRDVQGVFSKRGKELNNLIKELNCMYAISEILENRDFTLEESLQYIIRTVPLGWQHADITCARVVLDGHIIETENFKSTKWKLTSDVSIHGKKIGTLEVCYLKKRSDEYQGPFLKEELSLINYIAERIGSNIERVKAKETLKKTEEILKMLSDSKTGKVITGKPAIQVGPLSKKTAGIQKQSISLPELKSVGVKAPEAIVSGAKAPAAKTQAEKTPAAAKPRPKKADASKPEKKSVPRLPKEDAAKSKRKRRRRR